MMDRKSGFQQCSQNLAAYSVMAISVWFISSSAGDKESEAVPSMRRCLLSPIDGLDIVVRLLLLL